MFPIKKIKKSPRGEYEITTVNNYLLRKFTSDYTTIENFCVDAGTMESYHFTSRLMYEQE